MTSLVTRALSKEAARSMAVRTVLGAMEFGRKPSLAESTEMLEHFLSTGGRELDTAYIYAGGKSEEFIGEMAISHEPGKVSIATKVNPSAPGGLTAGGVQTQLNTSLERMKAKSVDILYLHSPDHKTPIEETLEEIQKQYEAGKFKELAISNYAAWQVVEIYHICKSRGWVLPTLYQGMYNAFTRDVERELFPALRHLGIRFYAYNPLAGGLMTGRYKFEDNEETVGKNRFFGNNAAKMYQGRFWKKCYFDALDGVREALAAAGGDVSLVEASLRWMYHHSKLSGHHDDAVILGASGMVHLKENLAAAGKGPLDSSIVQAFDKAWQLTAPDCQVYFR